MFNSQIFIPSNDLGWNHLRLVLILISLFTLSSCSSTHTLTEITPATSCGEEECDPAVLYLEEHWGPIKFGSIWGILSGSLDQELSSAIAGAVTSLKESLEENKCSDNCNQEVETTVTFTFSPSTGQGAASTDCGEPFSTTVSISANHQLALLGGLNSALKSLDQVCEERGPSCTVGSISLTSSSDSSDPALTASEEPEGEEENSTLTADVTVTCKAGNGERPSLKGNLSGLIEVSRKCLEPAICGGPVTGGSAPAGLTSGVSGSGVPGPSATTGGRGRGGPTTGGPGRGGPITGAGTCGKTESAGSQCGGSCLEGGICVASGDGCTCYGSWLFEMDPAMDMEIQLEKDLSSVELIQTPVGIVHSN